MEKRNLFLFFLFLFIPLFISGCAHVISQNLRKAADPALTFEQVFQNPVAHKGKIVLWGGEIVQTINQREGTTEIEVFQRRLGWRGEPEGTAESAGRFLVYVDKYLDPYLYRRGRKITVAGEVLGEKRKLLGEMEYRYPLIQGKELYLWENYDYRPYTYYPWGYYGPWGWGWRFHLFHHRHF